MFPVHTKNIRSAIPFLIAFFCVIVSALHGSGALFTKEEREVHRALKNEFSMMSAKAYILRDTLLYLMIPHKSEYYNINSLGFRGGEVKPKTKNGFHVMVMGGSAVFGDATKADFQTIPAYVEGLLRAKHPERDIRVYNLGIQGYTLQREAALARRLKKKIDPDLVIFYDGANDLYIAHGNGYVRYQPFSKEDETFLVKSQNKDNLFLPFREVTRNSIARARAKMNFHPVGDGSEKEDSFVEGYLRDAGDIASYFNKGNMLKGENIPVLFVIQPSVFTRKNRTPREQKIVDSCVRPSFADFSRNSVMKMMSLSERKRLMVHDLTSAFNEYEGEVFMDEVHTNVAGNRIVAEKLADLIQQGGYLGSKNR